MLAHLTRHLFRPAIDHWQGQHRWPLTLIVSVVGMTYLYDLVLKQLPQLPDAVAIVCWIGVGLALLTWQIVGTLKAVNLSLRPPADVSSVYGGYITVLVAVILVGLSMMDGVTLHLPKPKPQALLETSQFRVAVDHPRQSITIDGELNYGSYAAVTDLLNRFPGMQRIVLNSKGGHVFAARSLAKLIGRHRLDTHVNLNCFSACTIAFIAGTSRSLARNARLGFHRYAFANRFAVQTVDASAEQQKDLAFFRARGVHADFLERVYDAGHDTVWQPDAATLYAAGVITKLPK